MGTIQRFKMELKTSILISPCVLSPIFQAEQKSEAHWGYQFIELLMECGINIVPLPCPESTFGGYQIGLRRAKHGISYYESLDGYDRHCASLAVQFADVVSAMYSGGCQFIGILGIEHSPTCAINYMYSHEGMLKRQGMFMCLFQKELRARNLEVPMVGINRTYPNKGINLLKQLILKSKEK